MIKGMLAEMATGEGKTLTATLAAGTAGLAGIRFTSSPSTIIWSQRDAELMRPLVRKTRADRRRRRRRPDRAATPRRLCLRHHYGTNKELIFDYLRDRMLLGQTAGDLTLKMEALSTAAPRRSSCACAACISLDRRGRQRPDRRSAHAADHFRHRRVRHQRRSSCAARSSWRRHCEAGVDYHAVAGGAPRVSDRARAGAGDGLRRRPRPALEQHASRATNWPPRRWPRFICSSAASNTSSPTARCRSSTNTPGGSCPTGSGATACTR